MSSTQHILTDAELETLIADLPEDDKIKARMALRHQRAMASITDLERQWTAKIGVIQLEEILGESIDL